MVTYELNPNLKIIQAKNDWPGNPVIGKEFQYLQDPFRPDLRAFLRFALLDNPLFSRRKKDDWTPPVSQDTTYLNDRTRDWIVWYGHACFLFQLGGLRYLIDPQLSDMPLVPRRTKLPFKTEALTGIDYLLLSHDHRDHTDEQSIKTIIRNNAIKKILCPLRLSQTIKSWVGDTPIEEASWYQQYNLPGQNIDITFLPTRHWCRRGLTDFNRSLWGSFMFTYHGKNYYFGGDSAKTSYWREIGELFPDIEIALLGIGAYDPSYMMQDNHANPEEAFWGFEQLGAKKWWPMHHGMYNLSKEPASEPISWVQQLMRENERLADLVQPALNEAWFLTKAD